jgi:hypothetical protein
MIGAFENTTLFYLEKMTMFKRTCIFSLLACCFFSLTAVGSDFSRFEISGAYSLMRVANRNPEFSLVSLSNFQPLGNLQISNYANYSNQNLGGIKAGVAFNLNKNFGIVGEFGWQLSRRTNFKTLFNGEKSNAPCYPDFCLYSQNSEAGQGNRYRQNLTLFTGPRFSVNLSKRLRPFAQVLIGWDKSNIDENRSMHALQRWSMLMGPIDYNLNASTTVTPQYRNIFALACGGGLDLKIHKRVSMRLFDIELVRAHEPPRQYLAHMVSTSTNMLGNVLTHSESDRVIGNQDNWMNNMRFSFGAVLHLGIKQER